MSWRNPFPSQPRGWFAAAFSGEIQAGDFIVRPWFDTEIILYRDEFGVAHASNPYCPHLGAHLGHGGEFKGNAISCPFHGFSFGMDGSCIGTQYAGRIPKMRLSMYHTVERQGMILAFNSPDGAPPEFEPPQLDAAGWSACRTQSWNAIVHPQDALENSVDFGHMAGVHRIEGAKLLKDFTSAGASMSVEWSFPYKNAAQGSDSPAEVEIFSAIEAWGLGYYIFTSDLGAAVDANLRNLVSVTPTAGDESIIRSSLSVSCADEGMRQLIEQMLVEDFDRGIKQDIEIWTYKRHLVSPKLADGDGPIGPYRRWAKQFYVNS